MTHKVTLIAEAGVNHNGRLDLAIDLIRAAAEAGADVVKFQTFTPDRLVRRDAATAPYQRSRTQQTAQWAMLQQLVLPTDAYPLLQREAHACGITLLSSPFDEDSADFLLDELGLEQLKLGSGELTNGPLLYHIACRGIPLILSTGMSDLHEIKMALRVLAFGYQHRDPDQPPPWQNDKLPWSDWIAQLADRVQLLHCTTAYPCPLNAVNLNAMRTLHETFGLPVGYSDHTPGIEVAMAATALGAVCIEKHLTLDQNMAGPDHQASLEPKDFARMAQGIRAVETALGSADKHCLPEEQMHRKLARKSLQGCTPLAAGTHLQADMLTSKRPAEGLSPMHYWDCLGQELNSALHADEPLQQRHLQKPGNGA